MCVCMHYVAQSVHLAMFVGLEIISHIGLQWTKLFQYCTCPAGQTVLVLQDK